MITLSNSDYDKEKSFLRSDNNPLQHNNINNDFCIFNNFKKLIDKNNPNLEKGHEILKYLDNNTNYPRCDVFTASELTRNKVYSVGSVNNRELIPKLDKIDLFSNEGNPHFISPINVKSSIIDSLEYKLSEGTTNEKTKIVKTTINNDFISSIEKDFEEINQNTKIEQKIKRNKFSE